MHWRLGLDLGTNSLGWAVLSTTDSDSRSLDRWKFIDGGVRIFPDSREPAKAGRVGDALAVQRRIARGMRRNRDRGQNRMAYLMKNLQSLGLMPEREGEAHAVAVLDPYQLRSEALDRPLTPHELGRVIFHLAKRRGFKSNRKDQSTDKKEEGKRASQITALKSELNGRTLGQFLHACRISGKAIRFRGRDPWFPDRAMYEDEFDRIREIQQQHHTLSPYDWQSLRDQSVLFQHPLKPVERGSCSLLPNEKRTYRDTPIAQWFRIFQELNNLRWVDAKQTSHELNKEQYQAILNLLLTRGSLVKFDAMRKQKGADKTPLFPADSSFNLEDERRKGLDPHKVCVLMSKDAVLKSMWADLKQDPKLDDIFLALHAADDDETLMAELMDNHGLTAQQARAFASLPLGPVTTNLSRKAMDGLTPIMQHQGLRYDEAVLELGRELGMDLHHSNSESLYGSYDQLPYYGALLEGSVVGGDTKYDAATVPEKHYGRIANPTVHVALNQIRKLINQLIDRMGCLPSEINVELSRDLKLSTKQRNEVNKEIAKNTKENARLADLWKEISNGQEPRARDLKKLKLWEELDKDVLSRRCVFTGRTIAGHHLINGEVEIEHILPYSRTLDDTKANQTLAFGYANRSKGNYSPHEAFSSDRFAKDGMVWADIQERANRLPKSKRWRFTEDAMEKWGGENSFIARQLTDNAYIARTARRYLGAVCERVMAVPGKMTALTRGKWHLNRLLSDDNQKQRTDHRHHMVDAFTVALVDRGVLQKVSSLSKRGADDRLHIGVPDLPIQLEADFKARLASVIVSYKPDHGHQGKMFNGTAYGVVRPVGIDLDMPDYQLVVRKSIETLSKKEITAIRDKTWRERVDEYLYTAGWYDLDDKAQTKKLPDFLTAFGEKYGVAKLRILVANQSATHIKDKDGKPYKAYAPESYVCCDIWQTPAGKKGAWKPGKYKGVGKFWSYADTSKGVPDAIHGRPHPAGKYICRLFKNDIVAFEENGERKIMRVASFSTTNDRLDLRPLNETDSKQNFKGIHQLLEKGLRKVTVTPDGILRDRRAA